MEGSLYWCGQSPFVVFEKKWIVMAFSTWRADRVPSTVSSKNQCRVCLAGESNELLTYQVLVYERGCGVTLSCSSGAAAITKALHHFRNDPGRTKSQPASCWRPHECSMSAGGSVSLLGSAERVFLRWNRKLWQNIMEAHSPVPISEAMRAGAPNQHRWDHLWFCWSTYVRH